MSISLKSLYKILPDEWEVKPCNFNYINECYNEAKELGFVKGDEKEYYQIYYGAISSSYFWFKSNDMKLPGHFFIHLILLDDYLDSNELNDDQAKQVIKRNEFILLEGELPSNPTSLERYTLYMRDLALQYSTGRIDAFNAFITSLIDWSYSIIPLAKLSDNKLEQPLQVQNYIRIKNIGVDLIQGITYILFKDHMVDISFLSNPRYQKLMQLASEVTAHINDIVSYSKEANVGCGNSNILSILQKGGIGLSLQDAFNTLCIRIQQLIQEFQYHESKLLESIPNQLIIFIDQLKIIMKGTFIYSLSTQRYTTSNSPFIELHKSYNSNNSNSNSSNNNNNNNNRNSNDQIHLKQ